MSVVVRMEMPQNCCECHLRQDNYDTGEEFCQFTGVECLSIGRQDNCPIVCALPENHGRLVDAEMVKEILKPVDSISHHEPEWTWGELHESNCVAIDNAPTIVPAEAERSET